MPTLQEILDAPSVSEADRSDIIFLMTLIADDLYTSGEYVTEDISVKHVVDVDHDIKCGTRVSVLSYQGVQFAVVVCAGRQLWDVRVLYVLDAKVTGEAVKYSMPLKEFPDVSPLDKDVSFNLWSDRDVELGDSGRHALYDFY